MAAENQRARERHMFEFVMRPLAAGDEDKSCPLEVRDQLANLAWHIQKFAMSCPVVPDSIRVTLTRFRNFVDFSHWLRAESARRRNVHPDVFPS